MTLPSLLITGAQRTGKSILARQLAEATGAAVLRTDDLKHRFFPDRLPAAERRRLAADCLAGLLARAPTGLILEGVAIWNLCRRHLAGRTLPAPAYVLGFTGSLAEKSRGIETYRRTGACWTLKLGYCQDRLDALARRQLDTSCKQRDFCLEHHIPFLEIRPDSFAADIQAARAFILDDLQCCKPLPIHRG